MDNSNVVTPKVYKLYLQPLSHKLFKNKEAHVDYKHTQENADIVWEIVEQAKELRPLDSDLDSVYKFVTRIQEVLVYVSATCPSLKYVSDKLVVVTPINMTRKVRFVEYSDTLKDKTQKQVKPQEKHATNNSLLPSTGVKVSFEASGSKPRSNTKENKISQTSSSDKKNNKVEDHPRLIKSSFNKTNRVSKPMCNANVKHSVLNANFELICVTCNECRTNHTLVPGLRLLQITKKTGYGDYQLRNVTVSRIYYVDGLGITLSNFSSKEHHCSCQTIFLIITKQILEAQIEALKPENLKKCYADEPLVMTLEGIDVDDRLQFMEELVKIMKREIKMLMRSRIPLVKVRWNSRRGPEFTWKREDSFRKKYPHLFTNQVTSSTEGLKL
nr:putative reverse transcriptase domain-containing protein [Tanacetum cinerariifolium]